MYSVFRILYSEYLYLVFCHENIFFEYYLLLRHLGLIYTGRFCRVEFDKLVIVIFDANSLAAEQSYILVA